MANSTITEEITTIIHRFLNLIRKNNISFEYVYLYGSYAKGNPHKDSDIDLAIIIPFYSNKSLMVSNYIWQFRIHFFI